MRKRNKSEALWQSKAGNDPYVTYSYRAWDCIVDEDPSHPWKVEFENIDFYHHLWGVNIGCALNTWYDAARFNNDVYTGYFGIGDSYGGGNHKKTFTGGRGLIGDIRKLLGNNFRPHEWYTVSATLHYSWLGSIAGVTSSEGSYDITRNVRVFTPRVVGGSSANWSGYTSVGYPRYTWRNIKISGNYSGIEVGNVTHYILLRVNGQIVARVTNGTSGSLSGYWKTNSPGVYEVTLVLADDPNGNGGVFREICSEIYFEVTYPPPEPPTMGYVNNTTARSINTSKTKALSANWGVSYAGYPADYLTYEYYCYSSTKGELAHGTTNSASLSLNYSIPEQHTGMNIYWKVRARNSVDWSNWVTSGNVEVFWAYTEPAKIKAGSVTPNRFQLFNGNTDIAVTANCNIGSWGDRPGTRTVEYAILRNGQSVLKSYGRNTTNETGNLPQNLTISVPETDVNNKYHVIAYKRLDSTEYTASSDPRYPTTGDNHATMGIISFYEVIGKIRGSLSLNPSIIISGLPSEIHYDFNYDQQSSEKVSLRVEVYRVTTKQITKTINLDQNVNRSKVVSNVVTSTLVEDQQADAYEIRLKAVVTELLGNTHEYTLATLTPQVYDQPTGSLTLRELSKPIPTNNFTALVAKQATDIAWNYTYSFQGVRITKVELVCNSNPYGNEIFNLSFDPSTSPYYNNYKRISKGDFALGSQVKAYVIIYYQIIGFPTVYKKQTNTVTINITPTRYIYFLARVNRGEEQLNKLHPLVNGKDKTSKKIHLD